MFCFHLDHPPKITVHVFYIRTLYLRHLLHRDTIRTKLMYLQQGRVRWSFGI